MYCVRSLICCRGSNVPAGGFVHAGTVLRNGMHEPLRNVPTPNTGSSLGTKMGRQISVFWQPTQVAATLGESVMS